MPAGYEVTTWFTCDADPTALFVDVLGRLQPHLASRASDLANAKKLYYRWEYNVEAGRCDIEGQPLGPPR